MHWLMLVAATVEVEAPAVPLPAFMSGAQRRARVRKEKTPAAQPPAAQPPAAQSAPGDSDDDAE